MSARSRITRAAGVMSLATLISRILGYIKDMIVATFFGATASADVFYVAFRIPNLLRELFAEGSMSSAFIPVLTEYQTRFGRDEANRLVRSTIMVVVIFVGMLCILGMVFAPAIVSLIAPGFLKNPEKLATTVLLTRIMFPFLLFISLAAITMGSLNSRGVFFTPALAPATQNIVIIICVVALSSQFINPILSVAIGVTIGGLVQFLFQVPAFFKQGYTFSRITADEATRDPASTDFTNRDSRIWHPGLKKIGRLIIPSTAGLAVAQVNIFVSTILASFLSVGSITYLYYSMRLIQFPIGIFGVAMGMAVLPALSEHAVKGATESLKEDFSFALRVLFFITVPAMIGLISLKIPIVSTLFQRGKFEYAATIGTSDALMFYSLGIWAVVGVRVLAATFYAMQDTRTPVRVAVMAVIINILLSLVLMSPMRHKGLAFANAIASICNFTMLFYFLRKRLGGLGTRRIVISFAKTLLASTIMGFVGWFTLKGEPWTLSGNTLHKAVYLSATVVMCAITYMLVSYLLKSDEMSYMIRKVKR